MRKLSTATSNGRSPGRNDTVVGGGEPYTTAPLAAASKSWPWNAPEVAFTTYAVTVSANSVGAAQDSTSSPDAVWVAVAGTGAAGVSARIACRTSTPSSALQAPVYSVPRSTCTSRASPPTRRPMMATRPPAPVPP